METQVANVVQETSLLTSLAVFMDEGGIFMWVILAIWTFGVGIALERSKALFKYDTDGATLMAHIKKYILKNDVKSAIGLCAASNALLPHVLKSGLKRANQTKEQIMDAVESAMLETIPKIDKRMNYLSLVANISTLFGLLGTIQGLIESFAAVASADPSTKAKLLAMGISKAMNTTALGLVAAISIMVIHSILSNKAAKVQEEIEEYSVKIVDLLGTKKYCVDTTQTSDKSAEADSNDQALPELPVSEAA